MADVRGIDEERVTRWFSAQLARVEPPLKFELIAGGHSNLTYKVTDSAASEWVMRRPPLHHVLPTAHDMGREHTIISALWPTAVPVPATYGLCSDPEVNGAPFYVMGFVPGHILHDRTVAESALTEWSRRAAGGSFIDVLADLHAVDVDAVGLGDLARKEGYIARQLKRWYSQWQQSKTRDLPIVDEVHDFLSSRIPEQGTASVVHGDYRLGNSICDSNGQMVAVLDWEICTLGDPLADVGYVMSTWPEPTDEGAETSVLPSLSSGFPTRAELLERYATRSGRDLSLIDFYIAFSYWKSACIVEGVYARYVGGALGETSVDVEGFALSVQRSAAMAEQAAARL